MEKIKSLLSNSKLHLVFKFLRVPRCKIPRCKILN